jgi:outer membrane protein TolC
MKLKRFLFPALSVVVLLLAAGCTGVPAPGEKTARHDLDAVANQFHPTNSPPVLPELTADSSLSNFLAFALLNSPTVKTAFAEWAASVETITIQRSLPDPQITFQMDILSVVTSVMPGFMQEFPGPGKLKASGRLAVAESREKYFAFESAVLQAAFNLKRAYFQLGLLDEQLRLKRETLALLENQERVLRAQNTAGATALPEWLRVQGELGRVRNDLSSLADSRRPLRENFKAALGLTPEQPDPPMPARFESGGEKVDADELRRFAFAHNPQLAGMEAEARAAEAGIAVAYKNRVPDFSLGLMADVKTSPTLFRPLAGMTLPVWRDKIAAEIARAKANELAAQSRLKAAQIDLAVSFAEKSFAYRETSRNAALIENELLPQARQTREIIRANYRAGAADFSALTDAERTLLDLQLAAAEARVTREIALADLSLMVAGVPPSNAPLVSKNDEP